MHMQLDHRCIFMSDIRGIVALELMDYSAREAVKCNTVQG